MIFKQIDKILSGQKTQTRRVRGKMDVVGGYKGRAPDIESVVTFSKSFKRIQKWRVGHTYAVVPKRGQPTVWWAHELPPNQHQLLWAAVHKQNQEAFAETGWQPLRIRIIAIRREPLQSITEADALAEGMGSVAEYAALWDSINGKTKGARWSDNPEVWVLTFEVVKEIK